MSRAGIVAFTVGVTLVAVAYGVAFAGGGASPWAAYVMVVGVALTLAGTLVVGALRDGVGAGRILATAGFLFVVLVAGFGAALLLPSEGAAGPLLLGLPRRAAILLYGIGILPIVVLPFVYARDFSDRGSDQETIDDLRRACRRLQDDMASPE